MDPAHALGLANCSDRLPHVGDGELAGFSVNVVAQESAARPAGRPRQHYANEIPPEEAANAPRRIGRIVECVVVAMNEDDDLLSFRLRQAATNFALKRGNRLFVRGHDAWRAAIAGGTDHSRIRNLGKPANFLNSAELHLSHGSV